jgi:hypothetical protein
MNLWLKILFLNILLFILGFFVYEYQTNYFEIFIKNKENQISEVLAASSSTEIFETVQRATINQYPIINYNDSLTVPLEDKFRVIRSFSNPTKFTNHLCNKIDVSNTANGTAWKNDTLGCSGYTPDPKFVKLNFGSGNQRLVLYNKFSLFSVNNSNKSVNFESLHIDRFLSGTTGAQDCAYKYDPNNVYPVKSGNFFYLSSKFKGINNNNCLQFYDHENSGRSLSKAPVQLILGFQVGSDGELSRNYNRTTYRLVSGSPFGPGPQNSTHHALSEPISEVIGCSKYDSSNNCSLISGLNILSKMHKSLGDYDPDCEKGCKRWKDEPNMRIDYTCKPNWDCDPTYPTNVSHRCSVDTDVACGSGAPPPVFRCWPNWYATNKSDCYQKSTYKKCAECTVYYSGAKFVASLNTYSFSNFINFTSTSVNFNTSAGRTPTNVVFPVPKEYEKYDSEVSASVTNTSKALKFTNDLNNTVFTTDKYIFKITQNNSNLSITRYDIDSSITYNIGGSSYISGRPYIVNLTLSSGGHTKYSLDYLDDDIFIMAAGSSTFDLFKILDLNSNTTSTTIVNLKTELETKLPAGFKNPISMGVVPDGDTGIMYLLIKDSVFYVKLKPETVIIIIDAPTYNNFLFNGNVFSKDTLTSGFLFNNSNDRLEGNFLTSKNIGSNYKSFNNSTQTFNYPSQYLSSILGFSKDNSFRKFNYLTDSSITTPERIPLDSYSTFNPNSTNNFEILTISKGRGLKFELTNDNIQKNYNKYVFINFDKSNRSRIMFYLDCNLPAYSLICSGTKFNMKGSVLGQFYIDGYFNDIIQDTKFITIHENPDIIVNLFNEVKKSKIQTVSSTIIHLNYEF